MMGPSHGGPTWARRGAPVALLLAAALLVTVVACGDTGSTGTTNVQGGGNRAPLPGGQATARPTNTVVR
jgi:hypothetical protein